MGSGSFLQLNTSEQIKVIEYIDVKWKHDFADEPVRLVSELGEGRYEIRKLEFF